MIRRTNGDDTDDPGKLGGGGSPIVEPPETDLDVSLRTPKGARKNQTQADTVLHLAIQEAFKRAGLFHKGASCSSMLGGKSAHERSSQT